MPIVLKKRKAQKPDPPELAARAGEVLNVSNDQDKSVGGGMPAVVIDMSALEPPPVEDTNPRANISDEPAVVVDMAALMAPEPEKVVPAPPHVSTHKISVAPVRITRDTLVDGSNHHQSDGDGKVDAVTDESSAPILLVTRSSGLVIENVTDEHSAPIELKPRRVAKPTQIGLGLESNISAASSSTATVSDVVHDKTEPSIPAMIIDEGTKPFSLPHILPAPTRIEPVKLISAATPNLPHDAVDDGWSETANFAVDAVVSPVATDTESQSAPWRGGVTGARDLEAATAETFALLTALDRAATRDDIIDLMVTHLARSHRDAAVFVIKGMDLVLFSKRPGVSASPPPTVSLNKPSLLQSAFGTRLPYRGPAHDPVTALFMRAVFTRLPEDLLAIPIVIRERTIAIWCGTERTGTCFDEQLALVARAAATALERIVKAKAK
jgi:hypothetical protein